MVGLTRTTSSQVIGFEYSVSKPRTKGRGTVYFVRSGSSDFVKIGFCKSGGESMRLMQLQTGNPEKLSIIALLQDVPTKMESDLHFKFQRYWVRGEWFRLDGELKDFVERVWNA